MAIRINYNSAAVLSQLRLSQANEKLTETYERLSSGVRILSAKDDPAGLTLANVMQHNLRGLTQATSNAEDGISMVQTAEGGMNEISGILIKARQIAIHAANDAAQDFEQLRTLQDEFDQLMHSIDQLADGTQFGSIKLLNGTHAQNLLSDEAKELFSDVSQNWRHLPNGMDPDSEISWGNISADLDRDSFTVNFGAATPGNTLVQGITQGATVLDNAAGGVMTINGPNGSYDLNVTGTTTLDDLVSIINATETIHGARANYDDITGDFTIDSSAFGNGSLQISSTDMTVDALTDIGLFDDDTLDPDLNGIRVNGTNQTMDYTYVDEDGSTHTVTLTQDPTSEGGLSFTNLGGGPELVAPFTAYEPGAFTVTLEDLSDQTMGSTLTVPTGTYTATRHSTTDMQIGSSSGEVLNVEIRDMHSANLGRVDTLVAQGMESLYALRRDDAFENGFAQEAITIIDAAISEVGENRGQLGAIQASGLEATLGTLRVSTENLVNSESRIRDADYAQESATLARYNIQLQVATSMLAQANQSPQSVLQLLQ